MKKYYKIIAVFMAMLFCVCVPFSSSTKATNADEVEKAQNQVEASKKKINALKNQLANVNNDIASIKKLVSDLDSELAAITEHILSYNKQISEKQLQIDAKQVEIDNMIHAIAETEGKIATTELNLSDAEEKENNQYEAMKKRIQYMYECGEKSFLDLIFSSKNMSEMLGRAEYIASVTEYDREQLEELRNTKNQINSYLAELVTEKENLENQKGELDRQKSELEGQKNALYVLRNGEEDQQELVNQALEVKQAALDSLSQKQSSINGSLTSEQQYLKEIEAIAAQLKAAWEEEQRKLAQEGLDINEANKKKLDEIEASGGFFWPVPPFNRITWQYGANNGTHTGLDIGGGGSLGSIYGKPIYAAYSGKITVSDVKQTTNYGIYVVIDHGSGVQTLYAHMSKSVVSVGQTVTKGQLIGYVGSTGYATGPHLHLSLIIKGSFVNPQLFFKMP